MEAGEDNGKLPFEMPDNGGRSVEVNVRKDSHADGQKKITGR